jgi:hypothetical protein
MNAKNLLRTAGELAVTAATIALGSPTVHAAEAKGLPGLTQNLQGVLQGFGTLLLVIAGIMLGSGIAIRLIPTGSHRTKEAAGSLIDNALILAALATLGLYLLFFAGSWTHTITGYGNPPNVGSNAWSIGG